MSAPTDSRRAALADEIASIVLAEGLDALALRGLAARLSTSGRMLLYYFGSKDALVRAALARISARLNLILSEQAAARVTPGVFMAGIFALSDDSRIAPFVRVWADVIARAARGEAPYGEIAADIIGAWLGWIESRLVAADAGQAAAILSIVEGVALLEAARPGTTRDARGFLARLLDRSG
jgi:AcrR family transcriptional regulator